jgi:hypothetical protein
MMALNRKNDIDMGPDRGRRLRTDEHTIHGDILAAGNHVVPGMDEIYSEIYRETLNNSSITRCHLVSPIFKVMVFKKLPWFNVFIL